MATTVEAPARTPPPPDHPHVRPVRRWPRRLLITLNVFVAMCLLGTAGAYGYFEGKFGNLHKIACPSCRAVSPAKVMNVLLVGSDTRSTLKGQEQFGSGADVAGARSDTIIILQAAPKQATAAIQALPR